MLSNYGAPRKRIHMAVYPALFERLGALNGAPDAFLDTHHWI